MKPCSSCQLMLVADVTPPRGVWIETKSLLAHDLIHQRHAPAGACGLKQYLRAVMPATQLSRPRGGVWIETPAALLRSPGWRVD